MFSPFVQYSVGAGPDLPVIETIGCLAESPQGQGWMLVQSSTPVQVATQSTSSPAIRGAAAKAHPGIEQVRLVGTGPFQPARYKGNMVAVRGVLIPGEERRLNVTSLQTVSASACGR